MQSNHASVSTTPRAHLILSLLCIAMAMTVSTGCSTVPFSAANNAILEETSGATADLGQYQLKMETFSGSKIYKGTIDGPITIQTALERSGALKKYRNMKVDLFRNVEGSFQPLKMTALYDAGSRTVRPETDYGLRAGDSILVSQKTENPFSKLMESFGQ